MPVSRKRYSRRPRRKIYKKPKVTWNNNRLGFISTPNRPLANKGSAFGRTYTGVYRYTQKFHLTSTAGAVKAQVMMINSMYDPDVTGIGHQPLFHDTMSALYARYRVEDCEYKVTCIDSNNSHALTAVQFTQDSGWDPELATMTVNIEKRGTQWVSQSPYVTRELKGKINMARLAAISKEKYRDSSKFSAATGANPTYPLFMNLLTNHPDNASTITISYMVELAMHCTWFEPYVVAQS